MRMYRGATYGGDSVSLQNQRLRLDVHKRATGWAWGELYARAAEGGAKLVAVLDHLGELKVDGIDFPLRLEADAYERVTGSGKSGLRFQVRNMNVHELVQGTSFERWVKYPIERPVIEGTVTLWLDEDEPLLHLDYDLTSTAILPVRYIRGPWLKVGVASHGAAKHDGIFPGVEWLMGDEWSSGSDWFRDPWALRVAPHPNKVAAPLMALSHEGVGIGLAWDANARCLGAQRHPQPVFASPDFIDRMNYSVMGLMAPSAAWEGVAENSVEAQSPYRVRANAHIGFQAEVFVVEGTSLDVLLHWVQRHGLPEPPAPRWPYEEALDRIAKAYDTHLWFEGEGWGQAISFGRKRAGQPNIPGFLAEYVAKADDRELAESLQAKADWCAQQPKAKRQGSWPLQDLGELAKLPREELLARAQELLDAQLDGGGFGFDPDGAHYVKDDVLFARVAVEPLGHPGDVALDLCMTAALELLAIGEAANHAPSLEGARKALDRCMVMERPEGGDYWETPLFSPNLLAAGHAALAYYRGYQALDEPVYRDRAIYWLRCLLPFTHLWDPEDRPMVYNTKPCLCASDWYLANWVESHVQWEVLLTFALSVQWGVDWGAIDPDIDWHRYQEGITTAALRWMLDHEEMEDTTFPQDLMAAGKLDTLFADAHHTVTGQYSGGPIMPDIIAINMQDIMGRRG